MGLQELNFGQIWGFEMEISLNLGSRMANLVKFVIFVEKGSLKKWNKLKWGS